MARPRRNSPFAANWGTTAVAALFAANPPSLEDAMRACLATKDLEFISLRSLTCHKVVVLYRRRKDGRYETISAAIPGDRLSDVDDELYDALLAELARESSSAALS